MATPGDCPNCEKLRRRISDLERRLDALERAGLRQASPFSPGPPKENPKPPGQKPGHEVSLREVPKPEEVDRRVQAPLPNGGLCPDCRVPLRQRRVARQYLIEIPPVRPVITEFQIEIGTCACCGKRFQGRHPEQISDALGSASVQLGPRLLAMAADMKYRLGLPFRKVASFFQEAFGVRVAAGALARAGPRLAERLQPAYREIREEIRAGPKKHADETGWRINGRSAWLWVFATPRASCYAIRRSRGSDVVKEHLGEIPEGTLHCDGFAAYDPILGEKQTCLQHLSRRAKGMLEVQKGRALLFPRACLRNLRAAMALRRKKADLSQRGYRVARGRIVAEMDRLLGWDLPGGKIYANAANDRLAAHLYNHRDQLFVFLDREDAEPTNNRAEREIRPAVIFRKISAGNRSDRGARAFEILMSVLRTCVLQGKNFIALASCLLKNPGKTYAAPIFSVTR